MRWRRAQIVLWSARRSERSPSVVRPTTANRLPPGRSPSRPTTWCEGGGRGHQPRGTPGAPSEEGVPCQALKTWKESNDPDFGAKKNRIPEHFDLADGKAQPAPGDPDVVVCYDEFGPLNLQPHPGHHWAQRDERGARRSGRRARWQGEEGQDRVPGPSALRAIAPSAWGPHRRRARQLQPPSVDEDRRPGRRVGESQQRRARLHPALRQLAQPHAGCVWEVGFSSW